MSTVKFDTWQNSAGTAEFYKCRAWVNFNGTGTVAIRASQGVSSLIDSGVGEYTVNLTTALPDVNFCAVGSCSYDSNDAIAVQTNTYTTSSIRVGTVKANLASYLDKNIVNVAVFR